VAAVTLLVQPVWKPRQSSASGVAGRALWFNPGFMFQPIECFIGLRYLRSRRWRALVSFRTAASLIGLMLGVMALIVILSVLNGLEAETRTRLLALSAHATVTKPGGIADWHELERRFANAPGVAAVTPYVRLEGMLSTGGQGFRPAIVRGILPAEEAAASDLGAVIDPSVLASLVPGERRILLGRVLAASLGVDTGDPVRVVVPLVANGRVDPRMQGFTVAGVINAGVPDHDTSLALVHIADASELKGLNGAAEGVALRFDDPFRVREFAAAERASLEPTWRYSDWTEEYRNLFTAMSIEKLIMSVILLMIVGVAAFNIVASLMMVVSDKQKDIAILRTYGLDAGRVARVFIVQGAVIGLVGALLGVGLGLLLAYNIGVIVPWLEQTFGFKIMPGDVYYVTELPSEVQLFDVIAVPVAAFALAILATLYPARRAAAVAPASALRYD
jgi:lipoprotein-releasing system permease protein